MAVYRLIALLAHPNALRRVDTQVNQTRGVLLAKVALHLFSFLALPTHKKGVSHATQGRNTPYVVVKGKCQGLMFSDSVSLTPFKLLGQLFPRLRHFFAGWWSGHYPRYVSMWGWRYLIP